MLRGIRDLRGLVVEVADGPIGRVKDFYFDQGACVLSGFRNGDPWLSGQNANLDSRSNVERHSRAIAVPGHILALLRRSPPTPACFRRIRLRLGERVCDLLASNAGKRRKLVWLQTFRADDLAGGDAMHNQGVGDQ